jgi:DNA-binding MarR family transcriptional regulator
MIHPGESPGFLLWHATLRWQRGISQALAPMGLTHVQFVLLACTWWLNQQDQHPSQVELATFAGTDVKMTSQVLRSLERKGLLGRQVDPVDTRARLLRVTRPGARLAPRAIAVVQRVDAEFFDEVPADALHLLRALARMPQTEADLHSTRTGGLSGLASVNTPGPPAGTRTPLRSSGGGFEQPIGRTDE